MKNNGFTLIELLAVILILGIIALIAIPTVNNIVKESRKGAFEETNSSVASAVSNTCNTELITGNAVAGTYYITNGEINGLDVGISGELPESGYVVVDDQCNVAIAAFNNNYCATKEFTQDDITVIDYDSKIDTCSVDSEIATPVNQPEDETCFTYVDNGNDTVTITGYDYENASCSKDLVIPTTIGSKKVTTIADFAFVNTENIIVMFHDEVSNYFTDEYLANYTGSKDDIEFYTSRASSTITGRTCYTPAAVATPVALSYVHTTGDGYRSCNFISTATTWADRSYNTYSFNSIDLSKAVYLTEVPDGMILGAGLTSIKLNGNINRIGRNAFQNNNITGTLTIPNSIKEIAATSFMLNEITNLNLSSGLEVIGYDAFYQNHLTSLIVPGNITDIGEYSFAENLLTSVSFEEGIKNIANGAFTKNYLQSISLPNSLETIGNSTFFQNLLETVIIPNKVITLGTYAFYNNTISNLSLGTSLQTISDGAFIKNNIGALTLPNSLTDIGIYSFQEGGITSLTFGTGLAIIKEGVFSVNKITSLNIPNTVTKIESYAFWDNKLTSATIGSGITTIGANAFVTNTLLTSISVNRITNGVTGAKWGATNATITWTGSV